MAANDIDAPAVFGPNTPQDGHTFEISTISRGSCRVVGEPLSDDREFTGAPLRLRVRAWSLKAALWVAAEAPFGLWFREEREIDVGLPATLRTAEDVAAVCQAAGLERLTGEDVHPNAWASTDRTTGVAISGIGTLISGIHVQLICDWGAQDVKQVATIHVGAPCSLLVAAIRATEAGPR